MSTMPIVSRARAVALAVVVATLVAQCRDEPDAAPSAPRYVADASCAACHAEAAADWSGSHHDLAMQPATAATVLGDFADATFTKAGVTSRFRRDGERFVVETDAADGTLQHFAVKWTFGVAPIQQYLVEFPDGRVQCLPFLWDVERREWLHLYDEDIAHDDPLHWTGRFQNWNYMCADCHSTGLTKNFDVATDRFATAFAEIDVGCQACHGPGSAHVAWADAGADPSRPNGLQVDLGSSDPVLEIEHCAPCHSRRTPLTDQYVHGERYLDRFDLSLLRDDLYHADGQILDEVYVYGSFLQAKKFHRGVRCTDCHDPHTARLKADGNALCATCHNPNPPERFPTIVPKVYDGPEHHRHAAGTPGANCVDCHMLERTYMQVDGRRDHSFRIPRPDLAAELGTPDTCTDCHGDRDARWAADAIAGWRGPAADPLPEHWAPVLHRARRGDSRAIPLLRDLAGDGARPGIVRATAVAELSRFGRPEALAALEAALDDADGLVRKAAVEGFGSSTATGATIRNPAPLVTLLAPRLTDERRAVRVAAARVIAGVPDDLLGEHRAAFDAALAEWFARQDALADRPEAHLNRGTCFQDLGRAADAEAAYRTSLRLEPTFRPARFNLATLLNAMGRNDDARAELDRLVRDDPADGEARYSRALLRAETGDAAGAAEDLRVAADALPGRARVAYNLGLAEVGLGRIDAGRAALLRAHEIDPRDADIVFALSTVERDSGNPAAAVHWAERLVELRPADPGARRYRDSLRGR